MAHSKISSLRKRWYSILAESGFDDIELPSGQLAHYSSRVTSIYEAETEAYYRICSDFLQSHQFASDLERSVWSGHCDGFSGREISRSLNDSGIQLSHSSVLKIVKKLKNLCFPKNPLMEE